MMGDAGPDLEKGGPVARNVVAPAVDGQNGPGDEKNAGAAPALPAVSFRKMFKYAERDEVILMLVGGLSAAGQGCAMPLFSVILGGLFDDFTQPGVDILEQGRKYAALFGILSAGIFVVSFLQLACMTVASERITLRLRRLYLEAILRQEVAWFDQSSGGLSSTISENTVVIRDALMKLGELAQFSAMFIAGFAVGFAYVWQLTLAVTAITPLLAMSGYAMMKIMADFVGEGLGAYAGAGAIAEESFGMIRTVASFGRERFMIGRYNRKLQEAEAAGISKARYQGLALGATMGIYFMSYGLSFWYGAKLVNWSRAEASSQFPPSTSIDPGCFVGNTLNEAQAASLLCFPSESGDDFTFQTDADVCNCVACQCGCTVTGDCLQGGDILLTFFAVVIGAMALGQGAPALSSLNNGRAAAAKIYAVLDREPAIRDDSDEGATPDTVDGALTLEDVRFVYPTRPDVQVFDGVSVEFRAGETTALVGGSGCGKSTVTQLLMRFYDPQSGRVTLDGRDLRELNLRWLRDQIGLVAQEPVLFACSIAENISYGAADSAHVTRAQIEEAARLANAFDFVKALPEGFDTYVGEGGSTLSGGQKQRIAIARALVRDPALLILDEATSALDNESERIVQAALDDLLRQKRRTTIVVAHRLTTVRNADKIVVLGQGQGVLEQGTYDGLAARSGGHFAALLAAAKRSGERAGGASGGSKRDVTAGAEGGAEEDALDDFDAEAVLNRQSSTGDNQPPDADSETESATSEATAGLALKKQKKKQGKVKDKSKGGDDYEVPMRRVFEYSKQEAWYYVPALLAAAVNGATMPLFALIFAQIANVYFNPTEEQVQDAANRFSLYFVGLSVVVALANFGQFNYFGVIAERMTGRVRAALFESLMRQDVGFFDRKKNSVGALTSKLSTDAALVKASLADRLALMVQNLFTFAVGLGIAFYYGWELTLVLLALLPVMIIAGAIQMMIFGGYAKEDAKALQEAGQVLQEAISGIRTVTGFSMRERVVALYGSFLKDPARLAARKGIFGGLGFALSQAVMFLMYALAFWYGAKLIDDGGYTFTQLTSVFFAVTFMGMGAGQAAAMAPDVAKASAAISSVFREIDRPKRIDPMAASGARGDAATGSDIEFDLSFAYPTRPKLPVLRQFKLTVPGGSNVALVGMSGSGKSTGLALLQRFYDVTEGCVKFHGVDVREANVAWLRSRMGYVEQEPKLFDGTIFENLAFGATSSDNVPVTQEQVEEAARAANAHDFITQFPDGYQTKVGSKGSQLSGGQKQRICIARMLMREVDVFLLDEATAALDNESEALVQEAIDRVMAARPDVTTLTVAHKLKTIQSADVICVIHHGRIVEHGPHAALIAKNGPYARLYQAQKKT